MYYLNDELGLRTGLKQPKNDVIGPKVTYTVNDKPSVFTAEDILEQKFPFNVVVGRTKNDLPRTIHVQNYSNIPLVFEFHKFLSFGDSNSEVEERAVKEKDLILQKKEKPIISIDVLPGNSDCFVECLQHGVYFYTSTKPLTGNDVNNHRGNRENNATQSRLFILKENNSGKFRYIWDQKLLAYRFQMLDDVVLQDGQIIIEEGKSDQRLPDDISISAEIVSVVTKLGGNSKTVTSTAVVVPRFPVKTNMDVKIYPVCIYIVRSPQSYNIKDTDPNTRWSLSKKPIDEYLDFGWAKCGEVIFVAKNTGNSPQDPITVFSLDTSKCTPIYSGEQVFTDVVSSNPVNQLRYDSGKF